MDLPEWYHPELSISEMVNKSGKRYNAISKFLKYHNLPHKKRSSLSDIPSWYNENLTLPEMVALTNKTPRNIRTFLRAHNLTYKKIPFVSRKKSKVLYDINYFMKFYDKSLTVKEMQLMSNIPEANIRNFLNKYKLEYCKILRKLEIGDWYDPSKTIKEMSFASGIAEDDLRNLFYRNGLSYKHIL